MEKRPDLVEILGRTGGVHARPEDFGRALDLRCYKAARVGWDVSVLSRDADPGLEGRCGTVEVEGLRYTIRYGQRSRTVLVEDSSGEDVARPAFAYAVWAEPVVLEVFLLGDPRAIQNRSSRGRPGRGSPALWIVWSASSGLTELARGPAARGPVMACIGGRTAPSSAGRAYGPAIRMVTNHTLGQLPTSSGSPPSPGGGP